MDQLLGVLILLLVVSPFVERFSNGDLVEASLLTLVLLSGVVAVSSRRRTLVVGILLSVPAIAARWIDQSHPHLWHAWVFGICSLVFLGFVAAQLLLFILRTPRVDSEVI